MCQVSVIVPNYNHAPFLPLRLDSIFSQTFKDFEVILLDDCSSDNSREILELYRNRHNVSVVIYNEKNSGSTFKQWEKGILAAKGEYIWIAESDDYCEDVFLETLVNKLKEFPSSGIAYCQSVIVDHENQIMGNWIERTNLFSPNIWGKSFFIPGKFANLSLLPYMNIIPNTSAVVFRKKIFNLTTGFDMNMKLNGDWFFWIKMLEKSDLVFISSSLNYFRQHLQKVTVLKGLKYSSVIERYKISIYQKKYGLSKNVITDMTKNMLVMLFVQIKHSNYKENVGGLPKAIYLLFKFNPKFPLFALHTLLYLTKTSILRIKVKEKPFKIQDQKLGIFYL